MSSKVLFIKNTKSNIINFLIGNLITIISVPLILKQLGQERYGIWILLSSIVAYLSFSNFGLSSAAAVLIAKESNQKLKNKIAKKSLILLSISSIILGILLIIINYFVNDFSFLLGKLPEYIQSEVNISALLLIEFFLINSILSISSSILTGFQKFHIDKNITTISNIFSLLGVFLFVLLEGNLLTYVIIFSLNTSIFHIVRFIFIKLYTVKNENIIEKPSIDYYSYRYIFKTGIGFFLSGIAFTILWNTDNFIISHMLGVEFVTPYAVTFRIFRIFFMFILLMNNGLTPIAGKELQQNNLIWLNKSFNYIHSISIFFGGIVWLGSILFLRDLIYIWTGPLGYGGIITVISFGGFAYTLCTTNLISIILTAKNRLKKMIIVNWIELFLNLSISFLLVTRIGIGGVAIGTFAAGILGPLILMPIILKKEMDSKVVCNIKILYRHFFFCLLPLLVCSILIVNLSFLLRLGLGVIILLLYVYTSFILLPSDIKLFLQKSLKAIINRFIKIR